MSQLVQVQTDIYKPSFDENTDEYIDKSPYRAYERNCIRFECRCRAGSNFVGNAQFKQHIKSKTHKDFIVYYKKYYKEIDESGAKINDLLSEKELLLRKNQTLNIRNQALNDKLVKSQKQNSDLLNIIKDLNDEEEFEDCI